MKSNLREKLLRVMDGVITEEMTRHLYILEQYAYCGAMAQWLIDNGLTGRNFLAWIHSEHKGSLLIACGEIIKRVNRDRSVSPIRAGREFKQFN